MTKCQYVILEAISAIFSSDRGEVCLHINDNPHDMAPPAFMHARSKQATSTKLSLGIEQTTSST